MHTTQGVIAVRMLTAKAPCTTYSFRFLAQRGYFYGTRGDLSGRHRGHGERRPEHQRQPGFNRVEIVFTR